MIILKNKDDALSGISKLDALVAVSSVQRFKVKKI